MQIQNTPIKKSSVVVEACKFCTVENMSFVKSSVEQSVAGITDGTAGKRLKRKECERCELPW